MDRMPSHINPSTTPCPATTQDDDSVHLIERTNSTWTTVKGEPETNAVIARNLPPHIAERIVTYHNAALTNKARNVLNYVTTIQRNLEEATRTARDLIGYASGWGPTQEALDDAKERAEKARVLRKQLHENGGAE